MTDRLDALFSSVASGPRRHPDVVFLEERLKGADIEKMDFWWDHQGIAPKDPVYYLVLKDRSSGRLDRHRLDWSGELEGPHQRRRSALSKTPKTRSISCFRIIIGGANRKTRFCVTLIKIKCFKQ